MKIPSSLPIANPRLFSTLVLILGAVWIWVSRVPADLSNSGLTPSPASGFPAPAFTLTDQDGNIFALSAFRGHPVLLNFWASWCPPCRAEMPAMQEVYEQYQSEGFIILAVNSTIQDDPDQALAFYQELGLTFPLLMDQDGSVTQAYQVRSLPTSFFIDPEGVIQEVVIGGPMAEALMISRVERLFQAAKPIQP